MRVERLYIYTPTGKLHLYQNYPRPTYKEGEVCGETLDEAANLWKNASLRIIIIQRPTYCVRLACGIIYYYCYL